MTLVHGFPTPTAAADASAHDSGPMKEKFQQWQVQMDTVCEGKETEEEQQHDYCNKAEYWETVD